MKKSDKINLLASIIQNSRCLDYEEYEGYSHDEVESMLNEIINAVQAEVEKNEK